MSGSGFGNWILPQHKESLNRVSFRGWVSGAGYQVPKFELLLRPELPHSSGRRFIPSQVAHCGSAGMTPELGLGMQA